MKYTDTEIMDWLATQCFWSKDCPDTGVYLVISEEYAPKGAFTGNEEKDAVAFRAAVAKAMEEQK